MQNNCFSIIKKMTIHHTSDGIREGYQFKDPYIKNLFNMIAKQSPCFPIEPDHVQVIETPSQFYDDLLEGIKHAKDRVVLSSLYLGTGEQEKKIIQELEKALERESTLAETGRVIIVSSVLI